MRKVAILIAVEHYIDKKISTVDYAEADARELSTALKQHGFADTDQSVLVDVEATKSNIESRVRNVLAGLTAEDTLYFYYAGHGFAKNAKNYITCHDTRIDDLQHTSVAVEWLFEQFKNSDCKKIAMFLDSCDSGMIASAAVRGIYTDLAEDELDEFFSSAEHCVCFAACKPGQESHPDDKLKHGIWTYHLIEALNANATTALEKGYLLTSTSLQNYLSQEVPRTLRRARMGTAVQTPWFYGAQSSEFLLANVHAIIESRKVAANPHTKQLLKIRLYEEHGMAVRRLSGFLKSHKIPDRLTGSTEAFIGNIAQKDISDDLDEVLESLRVNFGLKRKDITVEQSESGGSILTPYFDYDVTVSLNPDDPSEVTWLRQVGNIREPDKILTEEFEATFSGTFDTLEFHTGKANDIESIVDQIEDLEDDAITVDYDKGLEWCKISLDGVSSSVRVTSDSISIVQASGKSAKLLIESFFDVQRKLIDTHHIKQIALDNSSKTKPKT